MASTARKQAAALNQPTATRELEGQSTGYCFARREEVPALRPAYDPNGALLLRDPDADESDALVLIELDGVWFPLSEAAEDVYAHTRALRQGRNYWFAVPSARRRGWPEALYELVSFGTPLSADKVAGLYGPGAGQRARRDKRTLQVRVRRVE